VVCASADAAFVAAATRIGARRLRLEGGRIQASASAITIVSGWRGSEKVARLGVAAAPSSKEALP
jgi:hypothetical protein